MQTSQNQTREDVEAAIEESKEAIDEYVHKYYLRWWTLGFRIFWSGVIIVVVLFSGDAFLPASVLSQVLETIGSITVFILFILGFILLVIYFVGLREVLKALREKKRNLQWFVQRLAYIDEQALRYMTSEQYMHQLPILIQSYRRQADRYRQWFTIISITTILLSAAITSLSGGWLDKYIAIPWIIPVFSALISILTSLTLFFKFREKGTNLQQTADTMDWEHMACTLGIGIYKGMVKEDKLILLAEQTEALRKEQQKKQLQLEQSSHVEQKALQSNT